MKGCVTLRLLHLDGQAQLDEAFEDSALVDAFGQAGAGLFATPSAIDAEVRRQYRVRLVGRLDSVRQRFYAITVERHAQPAKAELAAQTNEQEPR